MVKIDRMLNAGGLTISLIARSSTLLTAECAAKPAKPLKIQGAICGRVFDIAASMVPDAELLLYDELNQVRGKARANAKGEFAF